MKLNFFKIFVVVTVAFLCTKVSAKIVDPAEEYLFLDTPHFRIVFNAQQQALAAHYSVQLEKAYSFLAQRFSERPEKIAVILNDNTDSSNGYAAPVPYPHIMLYPVLPLLQEPLGEPSVWSLELTTHEFTHILSFYPTNGFMYALRSVLGTVVVPNALMPLWWLEGIAVYNESTVSNGGRLRSTYQDTVLRAMQIDHTLQNYRMSEINEILPSYPLSRPYLFGSILWNEMIDQKGIPFIDTLIQEQGGRVPFFVNGPIDDRFGMGYTEVFEQGLKNLAQKYDVQIQTLQKTPITPSSTLPWNADLSYDDPKVIATQSPAISSDGKFLAVITTDQYLQKNLKIYLRGKNGFLDMKTWDESMPAVFDLKDQPKSPTPMAAATQDEADASNLPTGAIQRVSWIPGKHQIVFDKIYAVSSFQSFSDLYTFDLKDKKLTQLTEKQRFREPNVDVTGRWITMIESISGKTKICLFEIPTKKVNCLLEGQFDEIYSWPTFYTGNSLLVTKRNTTGKDELLEVTWDPQTLQAQSIKAFDLKLKTDESLVRFPLVRQNKVYVVTNSNGVPNIALASRNSVSQPLSHLLTGSLAFAQDPQTDAFYFTQITSNGLQVTRLDAINNAPLGLPQVTPVFLQKSQNRVPPTLPEPAASKDVSSYSSWPYLWPHYWIPFISSSSQSPGVVLSVQTGSMDPLQYHQYSVYGAYDTYLRKGSGSLAYVNQTTPAAIGLFASQISSYLVTTDEPVITDYAALTISPDVFSWNKSLSLMFGAITQNKNVFSENYKKAGGMVQLVYADVYKSLAQVTPNKGELYSIGYQAAQDQTKKVDISQWNFDFTHFETHFLPRFHGLKLRAAGLISTTQISSFYGDSSTNYDQPGSVFLMRGYPTGLFTGRTYLNGQIEYRFPLFRIDRGAGTAPFFMKNVHAAVVADTGRLDGFFYNQKDAVYENVNTGRAFWDVGLELKMDMTIAYHLPIQVVVGGYKALDEKIVDHPSTLLVQLRGLTL